MISAFGVEHSEISKGLPRALNNSRVEGLYGKHRQAAKIYGIDSAHMKSVGALDNRVVDQGVNQKAKARRILIANDNKKKRRVLP